MPKSVVEPEIEEVDDAPEIEEDEIVTEPPAEEVDDSGEEEVIEEPSFGEKTGSALLAEYYKSKGLLPDDYEVPTNLTSEQLAEAFEGHVGKRKAEEIEDEYRSKGYDEQLIEYAAIIRQGGNPEDLQAHAQYNMLAEFDTDDAEDMKKVVTYMYQDKGLKEREIKRIIENADYDDDLTELFKEAREYFGEKRDSYLDEVRSNLLAEKERQEQERKKVVEQYKGVIRKKAFGELQINDDDAKRFERDFLEPTERHIVKNADGTSTPMKITKYQKAMMDIQQNPEKTMEIAYYILYGFKPVKEKARAEAMSELDKVLNPKEVIRTQKVAKEAKAVTTPGGTLLFQM